MKNWNLLIFSALLLANLFVVPIYSDEPDCSCDYGYIEREITVPYQCELTYSTGQTVTITCYANVTYCCRWDGFEPALHLKIKCVEIRGFLCYRCFKSDTAGFWADIREKVKFDAIFVQTDCIPPNIPDCISPDPPIMVYMKQKTCKLWENVWGWKGYNEWVTILRDCESDISECIHWYKICKDYSTNNLIILEEGYQQILSSGCSNEEPELPPDGKTWDEYWRTSCFALPCP